mmetsp:Transcript_3146/g.10412  ORF Transcript_3146/g.10412 Transcript_3146/m.10412 type:complete len:163 (+) Transcript_3146:457-945(+)
MATRRIMARWWYLRQTGRQRTTSLSRLPRGRNLRVVRDEGQLSLDGARDVVEAVLLRGGGELGDDVGVEERRVLRQGSDDPVPRADHDVLRERRGRQWTHAPPRPPRRSPRRRPFVERRTPTALRESPSPHTATPHLRREEPAATASTASAARAQWSRECRI